MILNAIVTKPFNEHFLIHIFFFIEFNFYLITGNDLVHAEFIFSITYITYTYCALLYIKKILLHNAHTVNRVYYSKNEQAHNFSSMTFIVSSTLCEAVCMHTGMYVRVMF